MSTWRRSEAVALVFVAVFLIVQVAIPVSRLGDHERSMRFGWQMFSVVSEATEFTVHTPASSESVDLGDYLARVRGDLDLPALLPPFLCEVVDGAESVAWDDEEYRCGPG